MQPTIKASPAYHALLSLTVDDASALWAAAARTAMDVPGMTMADVIDTIGSVDDPQIADCILLLIDPARYSGCTVQALSCELLPPRPAAGVADPHIVPQAPPPRSLRVTPIKLPQGGALWA